MAFQTNVLRGGEWVTETVDLQTVLKANANAKGPNRPRQLKLPQCGILTKTVFESQLVNTILFARVRSPRRNDVIFVRNTSIQLLELQEDSRLVEIATLNNFGSRIRNACVVGSFELDSIYGGDQEGGLPKFGFGFSSLPGPFETTSQLPPQLPPQLLFLVLENGDSLFLFYPESEPGFARVCYPSPMPQLAYLGFHLAIDPSSRYMALASHQEHLIIQEIKSHEDLNQDYMNNKSFHPIRRYQPRSIQGVIHKVAFLHPRPQDVHHVILLLIIVKNGKSRMVTYEWELGDDLGAVFAQEKNGHPMEAQNQLPLMVIPLTVQSAFMTVCSDDVITIWTGGLHGPPKPADVEFNNPAPTKTHFGKSAPLWTAWARPLRMRPYFEHQDSIYLAREDGVVEWIDIDEEPSLLRSAAMEMGFDGNISSAVACGYHDYADALFIGADSGPGGIWKVPARRELQLLSTLPTTAPTMDFVTTYQPSESNSREGKLRTPDRVFAASGCGAKGSLAEYRYGLKADIDLEFEYGPGVKNIWMFPPVYDDRLKGAHHLILSLSDTSAAIQFSNNFDDASDLDQNVVPYDLSSTTLALEYTDSVLVQITQRSVTLASQGRSARFPFATILEQYPNTTVSNACIQNGCIACSLYFDSRHLIVTLTIDLDQFSPVFQQEFEVHGEVNGLAMTDSFVGAGVWMGGKPFLVTCIRGSREPPLIHDLLALLGLSNGSDVPGERVSRGIEPISSIVSLKDCVLLGTRSGEVVKVSNSIGGGLDVSFQKFGMSTATISCNRGSQTPGGEPTVLVCCDGNMVLLQPNPSSARLWSKFSDVQVFPVDEQNPAMPTPPVGVGVVVNLPTDGPGVRQILMVSGPRILLARLDQKPGPVHRQIPTVGAPTRLIYSSRLRCIVAAVNKRGKPTLSFIDPDSGEDIGHSTDKTENPVEFISGLGKTGDTVYGLEEWKFKKDDKVWEYILVSTREGRLIVVDTKEDTTQADGPRSIRYWARFTHKEPESPIYSVLGCEEGLIYCADTTVYWYVLDLDAKKLKLLKSFNLSCPATSLQIANGKLLALTSRDSLLVLDHSMDSSAAGLCHADPKPRNATHMIDVEPHMFDVELGELVGGSITLVADRDCGVGGLWIPWQWPQKDCEPIFEAQLDASIRRFRRGRTRPLWDHQPLVRGRPVCPADDTEVFGVSLDGSLRHFRLLGLDVWRLFRFIQNISHDACLIAPARVPGMDPEPKFDNGLNMQVDGDILGTCLEKRHLERLLEKPEHSKRFVELLDKVEGGLYTSQVPSGANKLPTYVSLAYDYMAYFLRNPL